MSEQSNDPHQSNTYGLPPSPGPAPKKPRRGAIIAIIGAVVALLIGVGIGTSSKGTTNTASTAGTTTTVTEKAAAGTAAAPLTVTAKPPAPVVKTVEKTVEKTITAKPETKTVQVTAPAAPALPAAPSSDPNGPKANGKYLIGSQVSGGTWQCAKAETMGNDNLETAYWSVNAKDNEIIDNGIDTIAIVDDSGYTLELSGCVTSWTKVG